MDSARTQHVVSVPVFESFHSNVKLRCMEHSLHIVAKHFIQTIAPHFGRKRDALESDTEGDPASDGNEDEDSDGEDEYCDDSLLSESWQHEESVNDVR